MQAISKKIINKIQYCVVQSIYNLLSLVALARNLVNFEIENIIENRNKFQNFKFQK